MEKKVSVTSPSMPPFDEFVEEIRDLWHSRWLTHNGPKHNLLMERLQSYLNVQNVCLFANGHLALEMAFEALGLTGEVITTPFTFASTTHAIVRRGLVPRFCDIDPYTFNMDPDKIEALITEKTTAIVPVHVYGTPCDVQRIGEIAERYGLKVIYDAAHAFGVSINGKGIGSFGDMTMFSFHATKVFHTVEGGALSYSNAALTPRLAQLKQFGLVGTEDAVAVGTNAKMTEINAAMGLCNLNHIDEQIEKRHIIAKRYMEHLKGLEGIRILHPNENVRHNWAYFPVIFENYRKDRKMIIEQLNVNGIFPRKYFYPLTSDFVCYNEFFDKTDTPIARYAADRVLALPMYADLSIEDVDKICSIIIE